VLSQKIGVPSVNPILVPDFDGELVALRELLKERLETREKFGL
jgi:hypothetical protein